MPGAARVLCVVFAAFLAAMSAIDLRTRRIPNRLVAAGALLVVVSVAARALPPAASAGGAAAAGAFMTSVALLGRGAMGWGDVKASIVIGGFIGWPRAVVALFLSFVLAAMSGLVMIGLGLKRRKDFIPFGPFLAAGALLALLFGDRILAWYLAR